MAKTTRKEKKKQPQKKVKNKYLRAIKKPAFTNNFCFEKKSKNRTENKQK